MTIWELIALAKAGDGGAKSMLRFKGSVLNESALPESGNDGDTYLVDSADSYFAWDGEGWTDVGQLLSMDDVAALFDQVEDAGDAQVARIVAKGQEVEKSIPEDYSELSGDVDNLKSALNQVGLLTPVWEFGRFSTDTGDKVAATNRIRTKDPIPVDARNKLTVYLAVGFQCAIYELTSNGYQGTRQQPSAGTTVITLDSNTVAVNFQLGMDPLSDSITLNDGMINVHAYVNGGALYDFDSARYISVASAYDVKTLPAGHFIFTAFSNIKASLTGWPVSITDWEFVRAEKKNINTKGTAYILEFVTEYNVRFSYMLRIIGTSAWYVYNESMTENPVKAAIDDLIVQSDDAFEEFEIGSFDTTGDISSTKRVRTDYKYIDKDYCIVSFDDSLEARLLSFTSISPLTGAAWVNDWGEKDISVKGGKYIRALFRYKNDNNHTMDSSDVSFVEDHATVKLCEASYKTDTPKEEVYEIPVEAKWRIGSINATTGENISATNMIRTSVFLSVPNYRSDYRIGVSDDEMLLRVAVYESASNDSFIGMMGKWSDKSPVLTQGKYYRIVMKYSDDRDIDTHMMNDMANHVKYSVQWDVYQKHYGWLKGKTVAIFGDSISTTGFDYIGESSQVPEIIIEEDDVGEELKVTMTYRDFHPYSGNGVPPEDTSAEKPCDGVTAHDLILGGVTYSYEFTSTSQGGDGIPYVNYTISGTAHHDVLGQQEYTFTPTQADIGKHFGQADNHNRNHVLPNWWQLAQQELGFIALNASFSGSCISRARNLGDDIGSREQQHGSHAWTLGQIRRCGRRIPGTMKRESPDVIIVYRGTNDYGSPQNTRYPRINTDILEENKNIEAYFEQNKDLVGIVRANGDIVPVDSTPETGDRDLYGFTEAYLLTVMRLQKAYPFAKIFLCTLNDIRRERTVNRSYPYRNDAGTLPQWNQAIRKVAEFTGCNVIDFAKGGFNYFNCQTFYPENMSTGVHPYSDGQIAMANRAIADLKAQFSPMFDQWNCIKDLLNDDSVVACGDDKGFPTDNPEGAWEYVQGKIKNHCVWDGETTIG